MSLSYEQFKIVVADPAVRPNFGLQLSDGEARYLLENEAQGILYYNQWVGVAQARAAVRPAYSRAAITGLVLGLIGVFTGAIAFGIWGVVAGFVGVIFSHLGRGSTRPGGLRGRGMATWGVVLGWITLIVSAVILLAWIGGGAFG